MPLLQANNSTINQWIRSKQNDKATEVMAFHPPEVFIVFNLACRFET